MILGIDPCRRERARATHAVDRRRFLGGGGTNTVTQNSGPWKGAVSSIQTGLAGASNLYKSNPEGPSYYPGDTYSGITPAQGSALESIYNYGTGSNTASNSADTALQSELGASLNPSQNPDLQSAVSSTLASVMPQLQSSFAAGGRADSGDAASAAASGATSALGQLEFGQYNTNVENQQRAAALAPQADQGVLGNLEGGFQAATGFQQNSQNQLNADIQQYDYQQMQPYNALSLYESGVNGSGYSGGSSTTTSPYGSTLGNVLGGVTGTAGALSALNSLFPGTSQAIGTGLTTAANSALAFLGLP